MLFLLIFVCLCRGATLLEAVDKEDYAEARRLLAEGVEVNVRDANGWTPLHFAVADGQEELVDVLLRNQADPNAQDTMHQTPLHLACGTGAGSLKIVNMLVEHGANVEAGSGTIMTPIMAAAQASKHEVVRFLIDEGANVNFRDKFGQSALHLAAYENDVDAVKLLLDHGAELHARTGNGGTALHIAAEFGHEELVALLLARGADQPDDIQADKVLMQKLKSFDADLVCRTQDWQAAKELLERNIWTRFECYDDSIPHELQLDMTCHHLRQYGVNLAHEVCDELKRQKVTFLQLQSFTRSDFAPFNVPAAIVEAHLKEKAQRQQQQPPKDEL